MDILLMKKLYTQSEDGSFHPLTTTSIETLADILTDAVRLQLQSAVADKIAAIIDTMDLASEAAKAIDSVDMDDIASEAVRDEIENRIGSMDIDVSVSL